MDTSGFYTYDKDTNEGFYAPHFVYARDYELLREDHESYTYPVHGWYWFDSLDEAQDFYNTRYDFGIIITDEQ
jgi:hypothetical protein